MILTIFNSKGGVGKTTTAVNLAVSLSLTRRVLLCDLDGQYSTSSFFMETAPTPSIFDLIFGDASPSETPVPITPNLSILAGEGRMVGSDLLLATTVDAPDFRLSRIVKSGFQSGWDFQDIIFDVPSNWGGTAKAALMASTHHILAVNSEHQAFEVGLDTIGRMQTLFEMYDKEIPELGVLLTAFRETNATKKVEADVLAKWPSQTLKTRIRFTEQFKDLTRDKKTVAHRQAGTAREDYTALVQELKKKKWLQNQNQN